MSSLPKVINVALPVVINSFFIYMVPEEIDIDEIIGKRVLVNFHGRLLRGFAISEGKYTDKFKIKPIIKILDKRPVLKKEMVDLARWVADYYFAGVGKVLSLMVPKGSRPAPFKEQKNKMTQKTINLTAKQNEIYKNIIKDIENKHDKFYLYGITGSGKTEIYIKLIERTLKEGKNVIFLVPEIAISYQTLDRLKKRFGDICAVLHSTLKGSIRLREYLRLFDGEAKIVIGPRSALFAPLTNIGLIILDEENEGAYKSEESPRFHTRTTAQYIAKSNGSILVLGSATPSIESWYYAKQNYFRLYELKERFGGAQLPDVEIIDTSQTNIIKNLSLPLTNEINKRLQKGEQIVLLQNRRGFANFIKCSSCDKIIECPRCNISLTYHRSKEKLICHHCGYSQNLPDNCPACGHDKLKKIGAGTQRIEDEISKTFPSAVVKRMDYDSLKKESDHNSLFKSIEKGDVDIIVGTQMIAKGLHFPNIKFVGIINADLILNIPDFKAAERTYALITQVSGRAGREGDKGYVMIQTMNPEHYSIISAKKGDYEDFYNKEIEFRKVLGMPPFFRLLRLIVRGIDEKKVDNDIKKLFEILNKINSDIHLLGPAPCIFSKINNNFRYQILLKAKTIQPMQALVKKALIDFSCRSKNYLEIDVDPVSLF